MLLSDFSLAHGQNPPRPHCNWSFSSHASRSGIEFHSGRGEGKKPKLVAQRNFLGFLTRKIVGK